MADHDLPPLPEYTLTPSPDLLPPIPDSILLLILPVAAYWVVSLLFHIIDVNDLFPQYRLHTPAEILKRNRVTRWEVVRDVLLQHFVQTAVGLIVGYFSDVEYIGREEYDVAAWAQRIRLLQRAIPPMLSLIGIDSIGLAIKYASAYPMLAGALSGGKYSLMQGISVSSVDKVAAPAFAPWESSVARFIYWYFVPFLQFWVATVFVDSWQYFLHRGMHMNKWLYTTFHSRHHRLYVPYAFGALYNHPVEGFLLDTAGTGLAFLVTGMTARQGMWFFTCSTIKTVDDHCGYAFPFDPLQHLTHNNAAYHDIHHQSWGIKTNFSQPFFTFWDRFLNTRWTGDITLKYERSRAAAQKQVEEDAAMQDALEAERTPNPSKEDGETTGRGGIALSSVRMKTTRRSSQSESLKGLSHRLQGSIQHK